MTDNEKQEFLKRQLDVLEEAVRDAKEGGLYGFIPDLIKSELDVMNRIPPKRTETLSDAL